MIKEILMAGDAAADQVGVRFRPRDRFRQPVLHLVSSQATGLCARGETIR
jgi:hypothetical protein